MTCQHCFRQWRGAGRQQGITRATIDPDVVISRLFFFKSFYKLVSWELWNVSVNATETHWWQVSIGSGSGVVPWGNKPEPMLTQILFVVIWFTPYKYIWNEIKTNGIASEAIDRSMGGNLDTLLMNHSPTTGGVFVVSHFRERKKISPHMLTV